MNDTSPSNVPVNSAVRCEYTAAFLLLRLFLGLRTFLAGLEKFEANKGYSMENYSTNMARMAKGISDYSFIPVWAANLFAQSLGFLLLIVGVAILLGIKSRWSLFVGGLIYVGLAFGLAAVQEGEGVAWLGMQVLMFAVALVLVRSERLAVWPEKH